MEDIPTQESRRSRRSSRITCDILVELQGERFAYAGETVVINLHGALIRTSVELQLGTQVTIHVHSTRKSAAGRIVSISYENPSHYGVELDKPANIWGLIDAPPDWGEILERS